MPRLRVQITAVCLFVWGAGGAYADDANTSLAAAQCQPGDQLPCNCPTDQFPAHWPNPLITPCFVGDVNRQSKGQTEQLGATVFGSLNWPLEESRGMPNYAIGPAPAGGDPQSDFATVWESWPNTRAIFRAEGSDPGSWETATPPIPAACKGLDIETAKKEFAWANVPESILEPRLLDEYLNPNGQALIDRAGLPVRYEILFNKQAFDYVATNKLWSAQKLDDYILANGKLEFPKGHWPGGEFPIPVRGAIVAKAAWKVLDQDRDNPDHFHKSWAYTVPIVKEGTVYHGCKIVPVGLVGLHVIMKTDLFPDWFWMTFEHMALAPTWEEIGLTAQGVLPDYTEKPKFGKTPANGVPQADDMTWEWMFYTGSEFCSSHQPDCTPPLNYAEPGVVSAEPSRIIRMQGPGYYDPGKIVGVTCDEANNDRKSGKEASEQLVPSDVDRLNCMLADGYANGVFQFYQLKGTQWFDPEDLDNVSSKRKLSPEILANASMESFNQMDSSCISCHQSARPASSNAQVAVFDYIFSFDRDVMARASGTATGDTLPAGN